jgi:indole-3-glycerol phosphate synthase
LPDFLDTLALSSKTTIAEGYYDSPSPALPISVSLRRAIIHAKDAAIISEIKGASPSLGTIKKDFAPDEIAKAVERGGSIGISVLTEPKHFAGSLKYLAKVRESVALPLLMKDIVTSPIQLDAAAQIGANAVLLILALFDRGYCECDIHNMIAEAHERNLEVLLETHTREEFKRATESSADLIGINNRDLRTLKIDLAVTSNILTRETTNGKIIVSESGINSPSDVIFLRNCGANAFLIGSEIMLSDNVEAKIMELRGIR